VVRAFSAQDHELGSSSGLRQRPGLAHERVDLRGPRNDTDDLSFFVAMGLVLIVGGFKVRAGEIHDRQLWPSFLAS
jgi:ATP-binding cassette subfamily B protein